MIGKWLTPEGAWFFFITLFFVFYAVLGGILILVGSSRRLARAYLFGTGLPLAAAVVGWGTGLPGELLGTGLFASFLLAAIGAWGLKRTLRRVD